MKIHMNLQLFAQPANHTGATGMSAEMKTYYEKRLLDQAEPLLVHHLYQDKADLEKKSAGSFAQGRTG